MRCVIEKFVSFLPRFSVLTYWPGTSFVLRTVQDNNCSTRTGSFAHTLNSDRAAGPSRLINPGHHATSQTPPALIISPFPTTLSVLVILLTPAALSALASIFLGLLATVANLSPVDQASGGKRSEVA